MLLSYNIFVPCIKLNALLLIPTLLIPYCRYFLSNVYTMSKFSIRGRFNVIYPHVCTTLDCTIPILSSPCVCVVEPAWLWEFEVQNRKGSKSCVSHVYVQYQVQAANPPETVLYSLSHKVLICSHCLDNNFRSISWFEKYPLKQFIVTLVDVKNY